MTLHLNRSFSRINETFRCDLVWKEMQFISSPEQLCTLWWLDWNLGFFWGFLFKIYFWVFVKDQPWTYSKKGKKFPSVLLEICFTSSVTGPLISVLISPGHCSSLVCLHRSHGTVSWLLSLRARLHALITVVLLVLANQTTEVIPYCSDWFPQFSGISWVLPQQP